MSLRGYISSIKVFNTFSADDECFRHKKENFPSLLQMQLSKTPKHFVVFFIAFLESTLNFEHLKKSEPYKLYKIEVIQHKQVYFRSSNVSTDTTAIINEQMLNEKFTFCSKTTIKWNLTKQTNKQSHIPQGQRPQSHLFLKLHLTLSCIML